MGAVGPDLNPEELAYYSRQLVLSEIGLKGQKRLKQASVLVAGVGGLGCQIAAQLASMGVGYLRLADRDVVEVSNLQRQHLYDFDVVGYPKVEAAEMRLHKINPYIEIDPLPMSFNDGTTDRLLEGVDLVVDGLDRLAPRLAVNRACVRRGTPYVYGAVIAHFGNVSTIIPGKTACLECWQGGVDEANIPTCATVGVTLSAISVVASIQVSEAVRLILGREPRLAGKLAFFDLEELGLETVKLGKVRGCGVCGEGRKAEATRFNAVEEICGRDGKRVFTITPEVDRVGMPTGESLAGLGLSLTLRTRLGVAFTGAKGIKGSIFSTGVAVFEGLDSRAKAVALYEKLTGLDIK